MKAKAKALYAEYKQEWTSYSKSQQAGLLRRVENLAEKINLNGSLEERQAAIYLNHLALWQGLDLNYKFW